MVGITGVDASNETATRKLCESVAALHNSMFGDFWILDVSMSDVRIPGVIYLENSVL